MNRISSYNAVQPVTPVQKARRQEQQLQGWEIRQKRERGKIVYITPETETRELISMHDLEWAMTCVGIFAGVLLLAVILAIVAYWYTAWIVPAVVSLAVLIWINLRWKEWW